MKHTSIKAHIEREREKEKDTSTDRQSHTLAQIGRNT